MFYHTNQKNLFPSCNHQSGTQRLGSKFWLLILALAVTLLPAADAFAQATAAESARLNPQIRPIVREQLNRSGLSVQWFANLPISATQSVDRIFVRDNNLFALTNDNYLYCLDVQQGVIKWAVSLASALPTCSTPFFYQDRVLFALGKEVVQVRLTDGQILQRLRLPFNISTAPARTTDRLFVGSDQNAFYCLRLSDGVPLWRSSCPAEPTANVAIVGDNVYFTCKDGVLYVSLIERRELVYSFQTYGRIPGFAIEDNSCYIASTDTTLYAINAQTGRAIWDGYLAGGVLSQPPVITSSSIYQPVEQMGLLCVNRANGSLRFQLNNGRCLLAEADSVIYTLTADNELTAMDARSGGKIISFYLQDFTIPAQNTQNSRIFLATENGAVIALQPDRAIMH